MVKRRNRKSDRCYEDALRIRTGCGGLSGTWLAEEGALNSYADESFAILPLPESKKIHKQRTSGCTNVGTNSQSIRVFKDPGKVMFRVCCAVGRRLLTTTCRLFSTTAPRVAYQVPQPTQIVVFKQPWFAMVGMLLLDPHPIKSLEKRRQKPRFSIHTIQLGSAGRHLQEEEKHTIQPIQCSRRC